jgi:hypothetical protein
MIRMTVGQTEDGSRGQVGPGAAERGLLRAVLEDAVRCLGGEIGPARERPQLAAEAREWITDADERWPYSFVNVCEHLELNADVLRTRLLKNAPEIPPLPEGDTLGIAPRPRREVPAEQDIVRMIREGHPLRVVAETFNISISKASILSCGLASRIKAERDEEIRELRRAGWTHRSLAQQFKLSRIRIMRICARRGVEVAEPARRSAAA